MRTNRAEIAGKRPGISTVILAPAVILFTLALLLNSCSSRRPGDPGHTGALEQLRTGPGPVTVAVLPFETQPEEPEMGPLVRTAFYSHFSPRDYHDVEPGRVDGLLALKGEGPGEAWRDLTPAELGRMFHADFLIYGRVLNYNRTFLGIYSQIVLTVGLEMVSSATGETVWTRTLTRRSHEGGVPLSPLDFIPAALRSGFHMRHHRTVGLVDRVSRELASMVPEPAIPSPGRAFEVQVASFLDPARADMTMKRFHEAGEKGRIEPVSMEGRIYHRIVLGPFSSAAEAEAARSRIMEETAFRPILITGNPEE
jgi:hypothetical protein